MVEHSGAICQSTSGGGLHEGFDTANSSGDSKALTARQMQIWRSALTAYMSEHEPLMLGFFEIIDSGTLLLAGFSGRIACAFLFHPALL